MRRLDGIQTVYRERGIIYDAEENNWHTGNEYGNKEGSPALRVFATAKAAAAFIDRKIAAAKRIQPFSCIVGTSDYRINTCGREFERREVIGIIDEHAVWLKKQGAREKLNIRYSHLIEDNGKNREIIKELEAINEQGEKIRETKKKLLGRLDRVDLGKLIAAGAREVPEADMSAESTTDETKKEGA
ncbi:MAG: hypothetical protein LBT33_09295 [Spirochaetia bacterium]|jgi:hypothetical protein|nr:hypothetical protein [Spirochaetia bacterium]